MWPTYVINLADNTERLENARRELAAQGIEWTRLDAVNGWALPEETIAEVYDAKRNARLAKHPLVRPEIGCYLSHVRVWERIAEGDAPGALVLEDDFRVTGDLSGTLAALSRDSATDDWDIVKLYSIRSPGRIIAPRQIAPGLALGTPYRVPSTTLGYVITRSAAERLATSSVPFFRPVDEDHKFFWEAGLDIRIVDPQPLSLGAQETVTGTVGDTRKRAARADARPAWQSMWARLRYQAGYNLKLVGHRLRGPRA
ncbi:glycosyltransferase family 25 protein [Roseibacterium sp. SDUM158016]|uniref:glycosyltransferase family 25 protein n=1 Tax=Roseicyclus sediminis TaxID=2980997 RepID=UPI0021D2D315|nr:glycosyltransferase family 25 protein [Roseibacterium sp. SDUM158016]MCU4654178.1 glycosyltransferase family 25 protein [Roseibacterium sp. SDUM158016]